LTVRGNVRKYRHLWMIPHNYLKISIGPRNMGRSEIIDGPAGNARALQFFPWTECPALPASWTLILVDVTKISLEILREQTKNNLNRFVNTTQTVRTVLKLKWINPSEKERISVKKILDYDNFYVKFTVKCQLNLKYKFVLFQERL